MYFWRLCFLTSRFLKSVPLTFYKKKKKCGCGFDDSASWFSWCVFKLLVGSGEPCRVETEIFLHVAWVRIKVLTLVCSKSCSWFIFCFSRVITHDTLGVVNTYRGMSVHVQECCFLPSCQSVSETLRTEKIFQVCGLGIQVPLTCVLHSLSVS